MGPDRLIRRLSQQITVEEAKTEWEAENATDLTDTDEAKTNGWMTTKHLCVSCYLQGKKTTICLPLESSALKNQAIFTPCIFHREDGPDACNVKKMQE